MRLRVKAHARWNPHRLLRQQKSVRRKYLYRGAGLTRKIIQRSLRYARKIRVSELPDEAREEYLEAKEDFQNGYRDKPPVLRTIVSSPGNPPLLQMRPSPLKRGVKFSVDEAATVATIGVARARSGSAGTIEQKRPFVRPGLAEIVPRLPGILAQSSKG